MIGVWELVLIALLFVIVGIIVVVGLVLWLTRRKQE